MISQNIRIRDLKMEDQPDPGQSSCYFRRHLEFFEIQPANKTIKAIVIELKTKVREHFIRKCHFQPETYDFKDFRLTRSYRFYREYINYLKKLSSWLYRGTGLPSSLKRAFSRSHTFVNPYQDFSFDAGMEEDLSQLNNVMLCVAFNMNVCTRLPDEDLRKNLLKEFKRRNVDTGQVEKSRKRLIEVVKICGREKLLLLQEDRE